ncbi:putative bifunctional diguanylate cyclase/phosphodiesterase [Falsiroseomonas oryziterrae]|uniref:putative bifunctional diguanylate cyclase/phosphodiesterase n=1 Tax=Falsiroseomonas oryziterrae TaxID=2911368 RepID=UPI001F2FE02A|nr:bifunctional diguanylate cyclase/phosphodiesterase [Roseomonas sp. NPKOSM-4]
MRAAAQDKEFARTGLVALAVATVLFSLSVGVALYRAKEQLQLETMSQRVSVWFSSQALVELHRLQSALHLGDPERPRDWRERVQERHEILLSRLKLLTETNEETSDALHRQADRVHEMIRAVEALDPDIAAFDPADRALAARIAAALGRVDDDLVRLNLLLHHERADLLTRARENGQQLTVILGLCLLGLMVSVGLLIALLRRGEQRAVQAEETLRGLVDALPVAVVAFDGAGGLLLANGAARDLYKLDGGGAPRGPFDGGAPSWLHADAVATQASGRPLPPEEREVVDADGRRRSLVVAAAPVLTTRVGVERVVSVGLDVTDRREADARIRHMALHDALTGLPNRRFLIERLKEALEARDARSLVAVHCLNLARFRTVNDSLGHGAGDALLLEAAARIGGVLRPGDTLARLGGDEFAVVQPGLVGKAEAEAAAARLVQALAAPFRLAGCTVHSAASVGTALAPLHGLGPETLLQRAGIALDRAKEKGGGGVEMFSAEQEAWLVDRQRLEEDLRAALATRAFALHYQPKFRLRDGVVTGCEALIRWRHPERGWVPPSDFVPVAEEAGLIHDLTRFVLHEATGQSTRWSAAGLALPVAVNLSATHFATGQVLPLIREAIGATRADPSLLEAEVTEGVFLEEAENAIACFEELRRMGMRLALDDFGIGYSSLGYLRDLRFDAIKLDRGFVAGVAEPGPSREIVDAVVRLAHGLSARVVAEGVETEAQLVALRDLGCDDVQGFLLGRPLPPAELTEMLRAA